MTCRKTLFFKYIVKEPLLHDSVIVLHRVRWFSSPRQNKETVNNIYFVFKNIWNASCALNVIPMFLLLSLDRRLCWWTISPRVYHPPVVSAAITGWYLCWWTISPRGYHPLVVSPSALTWFIRYNCYRYLDLLTL